MNLPTQTKKCSRCPEGHNIHPLTAFSRDSSKPSGFDKECKACKAQRAKIKRQAEQVVRLALQAARDASPMKYCSGCKCEHPRADFASHAGHKDGLNAQCKAYRKTIYDPAYHQEWYQQHRSERLAPKAVEHIDPYTTKKVCGPCGEAKFLVDFSCKRSAVDGRQSLCKTCEHDRNMQEERRERLNELNRLRHAANRESDNAYMRAWSKLHPEGSRRRAKNRRARLAAQLVDTDIEIGLLHRRDKGICSLCHEKVDPKLVWPHPRSGSVDHILPLAKGEPHAWANVTLAHLSCNIRKRDGSAPQQMRLI